MAISEQLKAAVAGSGLSHYAVAKGSGLPAPSLHWFMSGERSLTLESADKLAEFFGMTLTRPKRVCGGGKKRERQAR